MRVSMKNYNIKGVLYAAIMISLMLFIVIPHHIRPVQPPLISTESQNTSAYLPQNTSCPVNLESTIQENKNSKQLSSGECTKKHVGSAPLLSDPGEVEQASREYYDVPLSYDLQDFIFSECVSKNVPTDLVIALIGVESDFNPKLISKTNDYGLMQINVCHKDSLRKTLQITNLLDEKQNIKAGVYMLSGIVDKYSDVNQELMVYNCGESGAARLWNNGVYSTNYSKKVIKKIDEIKSSGIQSVINPKS